MKNSEAASFWKSDMIVCAVISILIFEKLYKWEYVNKIMTEAECVCSS